MRKDNGKKVESGVALKRPVEVLEIEEGMQMKWWSVWETPKMVACGPRQSVTTPSTNSSRLVRRPAPLNIDTNSRQFCARTSINCNKLKLYLKLST